MSGDKDPLVRSKDTDGIPGFHSGGDWTKGAGPISDAKEAFSAWTAKDKNWVDITLKTATTGLGAAASTFDPIAALLSLGIGWIIEHCKPLTFLLDEVAGDPDDLTAYAETWKKVATQLQNTNQHFGESIHRELTSWNDLAGMTYINNTAGGIIASSDVAREGARVLASMGETLAKLVDELHNGVRDLVADAISQVISKALKAWATGGLSVAVDGPGIAAIVSKWVAKIKNFVRTAIMVCERFKQRCTRVTEAVDGVSKAVNGISQMRKLGLI